jgi:hypothetical protein
MLRICKPVIRDFIVIDPPPGFSLREALELVNLGYDLTPDELFGIAYLLCKSRPDLRNLL